MINNKICRMCGESNFDTVINFGKSPLVNSLIDKKDLNKEEQVFPLVVKQCKNCFLVQLVKIVNPQKIYRNVDYLYFSSDMPGLRNYFLDFALEAKKIANIEEHDFVVEIGSNDGIFISFFKSWACNILGVDPSSNVVVRALRNNIATISDFFSERLVCSIEREFGKAKLITGSNCIAHLNDLHDLMRGIVKLLSDDGVFVIECNYWGGMVKNKNYSLIYHDHFSYFSLFTWINFVHEFGMKVFDAVVTPAQGGSLRIFLTKDIERQETDRFNELFEEEEKSMLNSYETIIKYRNAVSREASNLFSLVSKLKKDGKKIAGYGAAAKGFSVLQFAGIDQRHIDYFVDDSSAKQGKYTSITHISVISREEAEKQLPDYFIITAPNYKDVIIDKEKEFIEKGGKFILVTGEIIG